MWNYKLSMGKRGSVEFMTMFLIIIILAVVGLVFGLIFSGYGATLMTKLFGVSENPLADIDKTIATNDPDLLYEKGLDYFEKGINDDDNSAFRNSLIFFSQFLDVTQDDDIYDNDRNVVKYYVAITSYYLGKSDMIELLDDNVGTNGNKFGAYAKFYEPVSRAYLILAYAKFVDWGNVRKTYTDGKTGYGVLKDKDFISFLDNLPSEINLKEYSKIQTKLIKNIALSYYELKDVQGAQAFYNQFSSEIDKDTNLKNKYISLGIKKK